MQRLMKWSVAPGLVVISQMILATAPMGCTPAETFSESVAQKSQAMVGATVVQFSLPVGATLEDVFISASTGVSIFSQAAVGETGSQSLVANFGQNQAFFQAEAKLNGNLLSVGNVQMDVKSVASGDVTTTGTISKQGEGTNDVALILGSEMTGTLIEGNEVLKEIAWPETNQGDFFLSAANGAREDHDLAPGSYGHFNIHDRNHVHLTTGNYYSSHSIPNRKPGFTLTTAPFSFGFAALSLIREKSSRMVKA